MLQEVESVPPRVVPSGAECVTEPGFQTLAESLPDIVWSASAEGGLLYLSSRWSEYTGLPMEVVRGGREGWMQAVHPRDKRGLASLWAWALQAVEPVEIQYRLRGHDGRYRWFLGRAQPVQGPGGRVERWIGTLTDVDDARRSEENHRFLGEVGRVLQDAEGEEAVLQSVASLAVPRVADWCAADLLEEGGGVRRVGAAHVEPHKVEQVRALGGSAASFAGMGVVRAGGALLAHSPGQAQLQARGVDAAQGAALAEVGLVTCMVVPLVARGRVLGMLTLARAEVGLEYTANDLAVAEEVGKRVGLALDHARLLRSVQAELAARQRSEERLREESRTVEAMNRLGQLLAGELDLQKLVQLLTDEAAALTGAQFGAFFYNVVDGQGQSYRLYALSGAEHGEFAHLAMPRNTAIFGPTFRGEGVLRLDDVTQDPRYGRSPPFQGTPEGHVPVKSYLAVPVVSRTGEVIGGLFFAHAEAARFDERHERMLVGIAAQAAVAMENARLYQRAQEAVTMRDEFLSVASHELKTPLAALSLQTEVVVRSMRQGMPAPYVEERAARIERQLRRLTRLVDMLLDVSRLSNGRLELDYEQVDLCALAQEVVGRMEEEAARAGSRLTLHAPQPVAGVWDRLRLDQVLTNLVHNAVKYGGGQPIDVGVELRGESACVYVRDRGMGIAPEDHERIFHRYERATRGRPYGGMGIGLWVVRQLVEALGGQVRVESRVEAGATFHVELPRQRPPRR